MSPERALLFVYATVAAIIFESALWGNPLLTIVIQPESGRQANVLDAAIVSLFWPIVFPVHGMKEMVEHHM